MSEKTSRFIDKIRKAGVKYDQALDIENLVVEELQKAITTFDVVDPGAGLNPDIKLKVTEALRTKIAGLFSDLERKQLDDIIDILQSEFSEQNPGAAGSLTKEQILRKGQSIFSGFDPSEEIDSSPEKTKEEDNGFMFV
jgi:hypothetical protein